MGRLNTEQLLLLHSSFISKETLSCGRIKLSGAAVIKTALLLLSAAYLFVVPGCKKEGPAEPGPAKPPGYQEDIPWPSLADSPFPINHSDPQGTRRSKFAGTRNPFAEVFIDSFTLEHGVSLGPDSTIYFIGKNKRNGDRGLFAFTNEGKYKWHFQAYQYDSSLPLVDSRSTIYFTSSNSVYAVDSRGALKWEYKPGGENKCYGLNIDKSGNLYLITGQVFTQFELQCISNNGELLWTLAEPGEKSFSSLSGYEMVFSSDGNILYLPSDLSPNISITAVDINKKSVLWQAEKGSTTHGALSDNSGNVYFSAYENGVTTLYCYNKNGLLLWQDERVNQHIVPRAIDYNGSIIASVNDSVILYDYKGNRKWAKQTGDVFTCLVDKENKIYAVLEHEVLCLDENGNTIFKSTKLSSGIPAGFFEPVISYDGSIIVPLYHGTSVYKIN